MFKIAVTPTYAWPVRFTLPGSSTPVSYEAQFARLSQEELDEMEDKIAAGEIKDQQILDRVLVGWSKIVDEDGEPIAFGSPGAEVVFNTYPFRPATVRAFLASLKDAKAKN